jgi:hypothetical protein
MAAKQSYEMKLAKKFIIKHGCSVMTAAKMAKISYQAIYISKWYKEWKLNNKI